jgi:hypothetical protein
VVTVISRGWELGVGARRPLQGDGARFAGRLVPMYAVRPLFGAAVGLITYFLLLGLLLVVLASGSDLAFEPMGLLSVTLLAGFFAQAFLERTRRMFDAFFGRTAPAARAPVPAAPPSVVQQPQQLGLHGGAAGDERG